MCRKYSRLPIKRERWLRPPAPGTWGQHSPPEGERFSIIDLDPQGHLTLSFGVDPLKLEQHAYHLLIDEDVSLASILVYHHDTGVGLVPTNIDLSGAEIELMVDPMGNNLVLKSKIAPVRDKIDYILIDCPPSLGLLTINALTAADGVVIPCQTNYLAYHGLFLLRKTIAKVQKRANPDLKIAAIIPTMFDTRTKHDMATYFDATHNSHTH